MTEHQSFFCFTLSSSDWSFSASSSVSSWILGPSLLFFFLSSSASLAALSAFSFFSFSCFICFSLLAFCASLLWWAKASLTSWKKEMGTRDGWVMVCLSYFIVQRSQVTEVTHKGMLLTFSGAPDSPPVKKSVLRRRKLKNVLTNCWQKKTVHKVHRLDFNYYLTRLQ